MNLPAKAPLLFFILAFAVQFAPAIAVVSDGEELSSKSKTGKSYSKWTGDYTTAAKTSTSVPGGIMTATATHTTSYVTTDDNGGTTTVTATQVDTTTINGTSSDSYPTRQLTIMPFALALSAVLANGMF